jgi:hypothetical protein
VRDVLFQVERAKHEADGDGKKLYPGRPPPAKSFHGGTVTMGSCGGVVSARPSVELRVRRTVPEEQKEGRTRNHWLEGNGKAADSPDVTEGGSAGGKQRTSEETCESTTGEEVAKSR